MKRVLDHLFVEVDKAYREGASILILSDRGVDENHVAIPSLLAVSAVHKHLVETKKCTAMSLILESGEPREVHHLIAHLHAFLVDVGDVGDGRKARVDHVFGRENDLFVAPLRPNEASECFQCAPVDDFGKNKAFTFFFAPFPG